MIIDCHQHVGEASNILGATASQPADDYLAWDAQMRLAQSQAMGVDRVIVMPAFEYPTYEGPTSVRAQNDRIAEYLRRFPWAAAGLAIVDPLADPHPELELQRVVNELGLAGIAIHGRFQRVPTNAGLIRSLLLQAPASLRLVAVHAVAESRMEAPWRLAELAGDFPQLTFLALSSLTAHSQCDEMIEICRRLPNVLVDLAGLVPLGLWIERFVDRVGSDRLLFGTDLYVDPPLFRYCPLPRQIETAHISDEARENICFRNAVRIFGLDDQS
jgi:uncharacterized protein